jgi:hypothetical protein
MAGKVKASETGGSKEILEGMNAWRKAHLKATFVEVEAEMEAQIKGLREQVLGEIIGMSAATEAEGQVVHCPECGADMERRGKRKRRLQEAGVSEVKLEREYLECPACGAGFFRMDKELALLPGSLFPHQQEGLVRLSSWMPFGKAAQLLQDLLGVSCSKATARRDTQATGAAYVALQTEAADQIVAQAPPAKAWMEKPY